MSFITSCLLSTLCPPGEYGLDPPNCTSCWPCEPGFQCINGTKSVCNESTWSERGATECVRCDALCQVGLLRVRMCDREGDLVCSACPFGFGCDGGGSAVACKSGTYSSDGMCVECSLNYSSNAGASECVCLGYTGSTCTGCPYRTIAVGTQCRAIPNGYGLVSGELQICPRNTYSSPTGHCLQCSLNAWSDPGATSVDDCVCANGYTRSGGECMPCKAGTVSHERKCILCPAGEYCLGKTHHEPCPGDMFSHRGAGMCSPCRMNSGCLEHCTSELNCTCDGGYINNMGECRRCQSGTMEYGDECVTCPPGFECKGGADVWQCPLTTWSPGNTSACLICNKCPEITSSRCNKTHNSVCEQTTVPLGVLNVFQQYTTDNVNGEMFGTFALLYVSSIPKAQLLRVCDKDQCVQCFQGICPRRMHLLDGPGFELAFEVRTFSSRLDDNLESLNRPAYLSELAKATMRKLTLGEFTFSSRIERSIICPNGLVWDKTTCREKNSKSKDQQRSWLGLGVSALILVVLGLLGWNGRKWAGDLSYFCSWKKTNGEDDNLLVAHEEDERIQANSWRR